MRRLFAILGSALFLVIAPGTVTLLVPWWISDWHLEPLGRGWTSLRVLGFGLVLLGVPVLLDSFARFALKGLGTPAPVFPTRTLVVSGLYRHVRNPMYVAVVAIILGQALILPDVHVLEYAIIFFLSCHLFVLFYEEPTLRGTFGAEYETFCRHVPRWLPRVRGWRGLEPRR